MSTWVVIPAKSAGAAKARLASALNPAERAALARRLLDRTVAAAVACPAIDAVLVVSADAAMREIGLRHGAMVCPDPAATHDDPLNAAIQAGCRYTVDHGATAALVLPADLPLLSPDAIARLLREAGDAAVAVAPDRQRTGTNALLVRPPLALAPAFGPGSFARHQAAALSGGLTVTTVYLPALALDLDTPDDLRLLAWDATAPRLHPQ